MSWLYSRVLVEEYSADTSLDGEQSVQSNGKPIPQAYCAPDKMTDFSRLSRFGMTYKPLTENLGEELLMSYRAGFHAKTSAQLEKGQELTESEAECGGIWRGWLAKYDPNTSLWRTAQSSLLEDLNECLVTLPKSGMTRNGLLWELPMLVQITKETEYGLLENKKWPTPGASDAIRGTSPNWKPIRPSGQPAQYPLNQALRDITGKTGRPNPMFVEWLMGWPIRWTDLKPLEMDKSHCAQQQPGES